MNIYPIVLYPDWLTKTEESKARVEPNISVLQNSDKKIKICRKTVSVSDAIILGLVSFLCVVLFRGWGLIPTFVMLIGYWLVWYFKPVSSVTGGLHNRTDRTAILKKVRNIPDILEPTGASTAAIGTSEKFFLSYLETYFPGWIGGGESFAVPGKTYSYSSDFSMTLPNGVKVQLEIDEPYVLMTGEPHHCGDNTKDVARDRFFLAGHWMIIRFAEIQIVESPEGCCRRIAEELSKLGVKVAKLDELNGYDLPKIVRSWRESEAKQMAKEGFRQKYLAKAGLIKQISDSPSKKPIRKRKH